MLGPERFCDLAQFKPVAKKVSHHVHAPALAMLQYHYGHAGWCHPRDETFKVQQPLVRRDVIKRMRAEDEVALRSRLSRQDRQAEHLDRR